MWTKREHAKHLAARGFHVFRLVNNTKDRFIDTGWKTQPYRSPEEVERLWTDPATGAPLDHNIGIRADPLLIVDLDVTKGKRGYEEFHRLGLPGDPWKTFTVQTPSGGAHLYYTGPHVSQTILGADKSIDIRSWHGYVVGPGSTIIHEATGVVRQYQIVQDAPIMPAPEALVRMIAEYRPPANAAPLVALDSAGALASGRRFAEVDAKPAIEGQGGHNRTYATAAYMKDLGCSPDAAFDLLSEFWNPRCDPPWDEDELRKLVFDAYRYGRSAPGVIPAGFPILDGSIPSDGRATGQGVPPPRQSIFGAGGLQGAYDLSRVFQARALPWIVDRHVLRGELTQYVAPGGAGKSLFGLQLAIACALGRGDWLGVEVRERTRALVINNEDTQQVMELRLWAIMQHFGFRPEELHGWFHIYSGVDHPFFGFERQGSNIVPTQDVSFLVQYLTHHQIGLFSVDPLISIHSADENDNGLMDKVARSLRTIAQATKSAAIVKQHTKKPPQGSSEGFAGDPNSGRGAIAVTNVARVNKTLYTMSGKDAVSLGVPLNERPDYLRIDDSKANLFKAGDKGAQWLRRVTITLPTLDHNGNPSPSEVGVLQHVQLAPVIPEEVLTLGRALVPFLELAELEQRPLTLKEAARSVHGHEGIEGSVDTIARTIKKFFSESQAFDGVRVKVEPNPESRREQYLMRLDRCAET